MITDPNFMIKCAGKCRKPYPLSFYKRMFADGSATTWQALWNLLRDDGTYNNSLCGACETAGLYGPSYPCSIVAAKPQPKNQPLILAKTNTGLGSMEWEDD